MRQSLQKFSNFSANIKSGLTLALVATPGAISLAVASGVNPAIGMITGIWASIVGALFGGSNYNIIGMTGALTGIIASYGIMYGPEMIPSLTLVAALCMLIAYLTRLERYLIFIPSSVIHGFTMGVALMLFLGQVNGALGLVNVPKQSKFLLNVIESLKHVPQFDPHAVLAFAFFFCSLILLRKLFPKIPGAIVITPLSIILGYATTSGIIPVRLQTLGSQFGTLHPLLFKMPAFHFNMNLLSPALVVAFIAILETMLAAKIADVLTKTKHNPRKEMFGLALANIATAIMGGVPASAALARTTYNINAGATNALSALFSGLFMIVISFACLSFFSYMPVTAIAAIIVYISLTMVEREHFRRLYTYDKPNFFIALFVALIIVGENPIVGILAGAVMALLILINKLAESNYEVAEHESYKIAPSDMRDAKSQNVLVYFFKGKLVYLNSQGHIIRFQHEFKNYAGIILDLHDLYYCDLDGVDALEEIIDTIKCRGQAIALIAPKSPVKNMLAKSAHYKTLEESGRVFETLHQAL
ncbi:MAG: SulP family inorganic anion transporter [Candidatus Babeliales bacterium]